MSTTSDLLVDGFDRVHEVVHEVADGLGADDVVWRPAGRANPIGWLLWHLARVEDAQIADVAGTEQVWTAQGWCDRFGLPFDPGATGYGQHPEETGDVRVGAELLASYHDAVHGATAAYLRTLGDADLDRVVDTRFDPPVTLGVRLVSILADCLQHGGQAAYLRGLLGR